MMLSTYIADFIDTLGGDYVFGVCGIPNVPIYEALQKKEIQITQNTHEAFSIFSCIGAYYHTKKVHFAVVTAGPGVTNTITPLSEAYISNTPLFLISINSDSDFYATGEKHDSSSGDLGVDTISLTKDITCFSSIGLSPKNTILLLERAYKLCYLKNKPVHVSLPRDFLTQDIGTPPSIENILTKNKIGLDLSHKINSEFKDYGNNIKNSLFVVNTNENIDGILRTLDEKNIFIASTSLSIGNISGHEMYVGSFEYVQGITIEKVLDKIDTLIILGGDVNRHFFQKMEQLQGKNIIHITESVESTENIQNQAKSQFHYTGIIGDIKTIGLGISENMPKSKYSRDSIKKLISAGKKHYEIKFKDNINYALFQYLNKNMTDKSSLFIGVGGAHNYANTFLSSQENIHVFMPSRFFNMGHCMKVIGYAHYNKNPNFVILGDGNYYMNGNDVLTAVEKKLNINFFILNNKGYSSLSSWRDEYIGNSQNRDYNNYYSGMNFEFIAKSMNCNYKKISKISDFNDLSDNIDLNNGVNIIEVISEFGESIPL